MFSLPCPMRSFCWWAGPAIRPEACSQSVCQGCSDPEQQGSLTILTAERFFFFWWVGPAVKSNVCLQSICWSCSQITSVYGNSLLPQGQGSLEWCRSLPWLLAGCDKARATLEGLLESRRVRMGRSAECRSRAHSISKVGRECSCWSPVVSGYLG